MRVRRSSAFGFVASTLAATALVPALSIQPAHAATGCGILQATIVGGSTGVVRGTEGDDVIVSSGARVRALGGDDTVCKRTEGRVNDDLGSGDDVSTLGAGVTGGTVAGSDGSDKVLLPSGRGDPLYDPETDNGQLADSVAVDLKAEMMAITRGS